MSKRLERMRANPKADWRIDDVIAACREYGVTCDPARGGGSHYKVSHPRAEIALAVPSRRPIKPVYIRQVVAMIDLARGVRE